MNKIAILFIGFNKTGTTSLIEEFHRNNFKIGTYHKGIKWSNLTNIKSTDIKPPSIRKWKCEESSIGGNIAYNDNYYVLSDFGCERPQQMLVNYPNIKLSYPPFKQINENLDALFILNTRNLDEWLLSRSNHYCKNDNKLIKKLNDTILKRWVDDRNNYYKSLFNYFDGKNNFLVANLNKYEELFDKINTITGLKLKYNYVQIRNTNKHNIGVEQSILQKFSEIKKTKVNNFLKNYIKESDWKSDLIVEFK